MSKKCESTRTTSGIELTEDQQKVMKVFREWYKGKNFKKKPILRIGGYGGTGKSVIIQHICETFGFNETNTLFVGYTGQSISRLRQLGVPAKTIHSTFMHAESKIIRDKNGKKIFRNGIPLRKTVWVPVDSIPSKIRIIIGDEWSFVADDIEKLVLSYNTPVVVFGDPLQLPPVIGKSTFVEDNLDVMMTQIMRQNLDSEIVELSMRIREEEQIDVDKYGKDVRFLYEQKTIYETFHRFRSFFEYSDIILTPTNKLRQEITELYRENIIGTDSPYPIAGEKLICRKNNWNLKLADIPLTNGMLGTCMFDVPRSNIHRKEATYVMDFKPDVVSNDYFDNLVCDSDFLTCPFGNKPEIVFGKDYNVGNKLEFAYALTVHLVQGDQRERVLYMDRPTGSRDFIRRMRYTAVTRATKRLTWIIPDWW